MQVTPPGVRGLPSRVKKGASQTGERQGVQVAGADRGQLSGERYLTDCPHPTGALVPAPCFLEPGWSWRCKQAAPQCRWLGDPWGCRAAAPASLESVKASDVHSCPGRGALACRMGRPVIVHPRRTPQDRVGRPWSAGYGPQGHPRSPGGTTVPRATCGPRALELLPA